MNRPALAELLRAFDAAGGCVELQDGDLKLTAMHGTSRDLADELRAARFDLVESLDGTTLCTFCGRPIGRHSAKLPSTGPLQKRSEHPDLSDLGPTVAALSRGAIWPRPPPSRW